MHGCDAAAGKEILKNKAPGKIIKLRKDGQNCHSRQLALCCNCIAMLPVQTGVQEDRMEKGMAFAWRL